MVSLLVRNYSIHFHCCCCCYFFFCCCSFCCFCFYLFQSLAHFMSTNTKPSRTIGDTQKTMTISATSFRGCNRFSPLLIYIYIFIVVYVYIYIFIYMNHDYHETCLDLYCNFCWNSGCFLFFVLCVECFFFALPTSRTCSTTTVPYLG